MADTRAAFRLGLAPVLLLGWNMAADIPQPFLAPCLLVTVLNTSGGRPPLKKLAALLVLIVALTFVVDRLFAALGDSPLPVWIALLAVATAAFARLARRPGDMVAMLTLMCASVVVVIRQWAEGLDIGVPALMGGALVQAIVAALIAHAILPSAPVSGLPAPVPAAGTAPAIQALGRAVALVVALGLALNLEDNSAILVGLTAVPILAASAEAGGRRQGRALLLANVAAAAMVLPLLAVALVRPDSVVLLLLSMAGGLWLARGIDADATGRVVARAGMPVFVVLLGALLPKVGDTALSLLVDRLLTLGLVMVYAVAALALLRPAGRAARDGEMARGE